MCQGEKGFKIIELVVVIMVIGILAAIALPNYVKAKDKAKEAEVKAYLHIIQTALERYATDHHGIYPRYILGGDSRGWDEQLGCQALTKPNSEDHAPPRDPLLEPFWIDSLRLESYLYSYPGNPFIDVNEGPKSIIFWTSGTHKLGNGDIRFGWTGEVMGNCLDDPRFLFSEPCHPTRLQYTMLPVPESNIGVLVEEGPNPFFCKGGLPQWSRENPGQSDLEGNSIMAFWPGQFFYRSGGKFFNDNATNIEGVEYENIWGWPYQKVNKYILGAYGSPRTYGLDVIRLTTLEGAAASTQAGADCGLIYGQFYQDQTNPAREASHPDFNVRVTYSNPEVFGGGETGLMPQFPYCTSGDERWMFGAQDGYRDGVILVLTNGRQGWAAK